jgi:hypothetical protein
MDYKSNAYSKERIEEDFVLGFWLMDYKNN